MNFKVLFLLIIISVICSAMVPVVNQNLCTFNSIGFVPASPDHTFTVVQKPNPGAPYEDGNFDVTWHEVEDKRHKFFKKISHNYDEKQVLQIMNCTKSGKQEFGRVCQIYDSDLGEYYKNAFGEQSVYICKIPDNHFAIFLRFVLKLSDFKTNAGGRWSTFTGLYEYDNIQMANDIIRTQGRKLSKLINQTRLTTFDINSNLNIIPDFVKGSLAWVFNDHRNSGFVKGIQTGTSYDITDEGYIKVIPAGTEFVLGNIYNGTQLIKQTCDRLWIKDEDDCGNSYDNYLRGRHPHKRHRNQGYGNGPYWRY